MNGNGNNPQLDDWPDPSPQEVHATARDVVASGISVIPISDDESKRPDGRVLLRELDPKDNQYHATWKPYQKAKPTDEDLVKWFGGNTPRGLAYVCGAVSGNLEVIDGDDLPLCPEYFELVKTHNSDLYKRLVIIETPSGCNHVPYRCELIEGNQKLAMRAVEVPEGTKGAKKDGDRWIKLDVLFETRGEGGYIVAPGSPLCVHPAGKPYKFIKGSFETIPTVTLAERELLLGLARALNEYHPVEEKREKTEYKQIAQGDGDESLPGKDFDKRGDPLPFLLNNGWTIDRRSGAVIFLKKPGAKGRGHHATLHAVAHNIFYNFSTSVTPFDSDRGYTAWQVYALLEHNGDFKAAAKALAAQGYGQSNKKSATDTIKSNGSKKSKSAPEAAALIDDAILLLLNQYPEQFTEENKMTLLALFAVFGGRTTAAVSHGLLASRIKQREGTEKGKKADAQFGARRLMNLKKALRRSIAYNVLEMTLHSRSQPKTKNGNYRPSRYKLDMKPFFQVLGLAETIYKEWCCGAPRLPEWINPETGDPYPPNQGRCRELAAQLIADQYRKDAKQVQREEANLKPKSDRASKEVAALYSLMRDVRKLADVWDERDFCDEDRIIESEKLWGQLRQILLHKNREERDRILRDLLGLKPRRRKAPSFMYEVRLSDGDSIAVDIDSIDSKVNDSYIVNAQKPDFALHLSKWRSLGEISENLPRPAIWQNKDHDEHCTVVGIFDAPGPDGRLYVKTLESAGGVPFDELEFLPVAGPPDSLVDALLEDDQMEGYL